MSNEIRQAHAIRLCSGEYDLRIELEDDGWFISSVEYDHGDSHQRFATIPRYLLFVRSIWDGQVDECFLWAPKDTAELTQCLLEQYAQFGGPSFAWEAELFDLEEGIELDFERVINVFPKVRA